MREKLFLYLRQELPYELTVEPELWERREDGSVRAEMTIYVKRDNQKTIVLGRSGEMIKKSGSPRVVKSKMNWTSVSIFSFFVKVRENWIDDPARYTAWNLDFNV